MRLARLLTGRVRSPRGSGGCGGMFTSYAGAIGSADAPPSASVNANSVTGNRCAGAFWLKWLGASRRYHRSATSRGTDFAKS
jgi:hypothetical protein